MLKAGTMRLRVAPGKTAIHGAAKAHLRQDRQHVLMSHSALDVSAPTTGCARRWGANHSKADPYLPPDVVFQDT